MSKSLNIYLVLSSLHVTDKKTDSRRNWVTSVCIENLTGLCKISPKIQSREIQEVGSNRLELDMAFPHPWKTVLWQSFMKREKSDSSIKRELYIKQPIRDLNFLSVATSLIEAVVSEFLEYGLPNFMVHMNQSRCLLKKKFVPELLYQKLLFSNICSWPGINIWIFPGNNWNSLPNSDLYCQYPTSLRNIYLY